VCRIGSGRQTVPTLTTGWTTSRGVGTVSPHTFDRNSESGTACHDRRACALAVLCVAAAVVAALLEFLLALGARDAYLRTWGSPAVPNIRSEGTATGGRSHLVQEMTPRRTAYNTISAVLWTSSF
jgi:hypothetical protein